MDGETVADVEPRGVERWLGELARELGEDSYGPGAVRQVLIPKSSRGNSALWAYRACGIESRRRRRC